MINFKEIKRYYFNHLFNFNFFIRSLMAIFNFFNSILLVFALFAGFLSNLEYLNLIRVFKKLMIGSTLKTVLF